MTTTERSGTRAAARTLPPIAERDLTEVLWEQADEGVLAITLNRPERLNALSFRLLREVQQLIDHAAATPEVRVVTLRGAGGRAFCSGDDLKGMNPEPGYDSSETVHQPLLLSIRELPKPVVALVTGYALGHGWELASACDMRLVADNCEVGDHRVQRSIAMNGGTSWFVPRLVGRGRALELLMTGRHLNSEEAVDWGWANHAWPLDEFDERSAEFVSMLAQLPTIDVGVFKAAVDYSAEHSLRDSLAHELEVSKRTAGTDDAAEGRESWWQKRVPEYHGR